MNAYTATLTFDGAGAKQFIVPNGGKACMLRAEPLAANTHVFYVGNKLMNIGVDTHTGVIKQVAAPPAATVPLDAYDSPNRSVNPVLNESDWFFDGTATEGCKITWYE